MATKSFLKNVTLRSKSDCQSFIRALERSESMPRGKKQDAHIMAQDMTAEQIRKIFVQKAEETGEAQ